MQDTGATLRLVNATRCCRSPSVIFDADKYNNKVVHKAMQYVEIVHRPKAPWELQSRICPRSPRQVGKKTSTILLRAHLLFQTPCPLSDSLSVSSQIAFYRCPYRFRVVSRVLAQRSHSCCGSTRGKELKLGDLQFLAFYCANLPGLSLQA